MPGMCFLAFNTLSTKPLGTSSCPVDYLSKAATELPVTFPLQGKDSLHSFPILLKQSPRLSVKEDRAWLACLEKSLGLLMGNRTARFTGKKNASQ